jgi:hypothetical protein
MHSFGDVRRILHRQIGRRLTEKLYKDLQELAEVRGQQSGWGEVHCEQRGPCVYATVTFVKPEMKTGRLNAYRRVTYIVRHREDHAWWEEYRAERHLESGEWVAQPA